ncbi:MAG: hypothetical protein ACFFFG_17355 [Candidatus Thorarchaeota archaeon]
MSRSRPPFELILNDILVQNLIPLPLIDLLPQGWKRIGHVGILTLDPRLYPWKQIIGKTYLKHLPELSTMAHKIGITTQQTRTPDYEVLAGDPQTVTVHKELHCTFMLDALRLTFSSGNHAERLHLIHASQPHEHVIDMFACVGNLSIPLAVHTPTVKVLGIDINPLACTYLAKNIQMNHLTDRYYAVCGDNRIATPVDWADRVIMGYFDLDSAHFINALSSLRQTRGGTIHAHGLSSNRNPQDWYQNVKNIISGSFPHFKISTIKKRIIKTVAAGIEHFADDITIVPQ